MDWCHLSMCFRLGLQCYPIHGLPSWRRGGADEGSWDRWHWTLWPGGWKLMENEKVKILFMYTSVIDMMKTKCVCHSYLIKTGRVNVECLLKAQQDSKAAAWAWCDGFVLQDCSSKCTSMNWLLWVWLRSYVLLWEHEYVCSQVHRWVNYESMLKECLVGRMATVPIAAIKGTHTHTHWTHPQYLCISGLTCCF